MLDSINTVLWVSGNIIAALIFVSALAFAVAYPILFNPGLTTAGKSIWRAIFSVGGFGFLAVIATYVDGRVPWNQMPEDVDPARPLLRAAVYGFIAYTFLSLVVLLFIRRFAPSRLRTAPQMRQVLTEDLHAVGVPFADSDKVVDGLIRRGWVKPGLLPAPEDTLNVKPRDLHRSGS